MDFHVTLSGRQTIAIALYIDVYWIFYTQPNRPGSDIKIKINTSSHEQDLYCILPRKIGMNVTDLCKKICRGEDPANSCQVSDQDLC